MMKGKSRRKHIPQAIRPASEVPSSLQKNYTPKGSHAPGLPYHVGPSPSYASCPPTYNGENSSEDTPLIHPDNRRKSYIAWMLIGTVLAHITIYMLVPLVMQSLASERAQWDKELRERRQHEQTRIREWEDLFNARQERERLRVEQWERELMDRHTAEQSRIREWEDLLKARQERERQRVEQWERELKDRHMAEQSRIREWEELLKAKQERERQREEQWHREEEERQRLGLYWGNLEADAHCTAYNTRCYWARLLNTVPYEYNWLKPCQDIPIDIHGRSVKTTACEVKDDGSVYGHWQVDFDEPACTPYWDQFKDKGCVAPGSRRRRFEAHLENIHEGEDGDRLCSTAPYSFYGMHFDRPMTCAYWGKHGMFGIWEADDDNC